MKPQAHMDTRSHRQTIRLIISHPANILSVLAVCRCMRRMARQSVLLVVLSPLLETGPQVNLSLLAPLLNALPFSSLSHSFLLISSLLLSSSLFSSLLFFFLLLFYLSPLLLHFNRSTAVPLPVHPSGALSIGSHLGPTPTLGQGARVPL